MCGIAGWLGKVQGDGTCAEQIAQALYHRGPDGKGIQSWPEATLIHTRLSIIDLSSAGAQPMTNENGTIWVVFNGEIYNHKELRHKLESSGHVFRSRSDTEVLVHLYEEKGCEFAKYLKGMFAVAIYDTTTHSLILARDRFGIKPLFYAEGKGFLAFGSEINALLKVPGVNTQPDRQAIYDFSALFFIPAPATFYTGVRSLLPGQTLEASWDPQGITLKTRTFHKWEVGDESSLSLKHASLQAEELLCAAVQRQLESDVSLGSLLSGGIDSSLVSAVAQDALRGGLRTFNVRFPDKEFDETSFAVTVSNEIGSRHQILEMPKLNGNWDSIKSLLLHAGQPFADTSLFAMNAICHLMRAHVKVALSGDGGDEGFGGYNFYWWIQLIAQWQALPAFAQTGSSQALRILSGAGIVPHRIPLRIRELSDCDNTSILQNLFSWVREKDHGRLCRDRDLMPIRRHFEPQWSYNFSKSASRIDWLTAQATEVNVRLKLADDFLFKVDSASMKESLEVRVPFLDEDLFAFGLNLPYHLKAKGFTGKRVLREIAQRRLPSRVARKPKGGFVLPFDTWTDPSFKTTLKEVLLGSNDRLEEYFNPDVFRPIVKTFCQGNQYKDFSRGAHWSLVVMLLSVFLTLDTTS